MGGQHVEGVPADVQADVPVGGHDETRAVKATARPSPAIWLAALVLSNNIRKTSKESLLFRFDFGRARNVFRLQGIYGDAKCFSPQDVEEAHLSLSIMSNRTRLLA